MVMFYLDTSILIDFLEDRRGFNDEPFGSYAQRLIALIKLRGDSLILSEIILEELYLFSTSKSSVAVNRIARGRNSSNFDRSDGDIDYYARRC